MPFDEGLAERVRDAFAGMGIDDTVEKRMFGGIAFMLHGHMCCGIVGEKLMVRVGPEAYEQALTEPHAAPMDFTGKPLRGFIYVNADGFAEDETLAAWIDRGVTFANSLPPK